jgi:hypothetical protein
MAASLDTILASIQNAVIAINGWTQATTSINGMSNVNNITAATVVKPSSGRVCSVSIIVPGTGDGAIYDASSIVSIGLSKIYVVSHTSSVGIYTIGFNVSYGIVVVPGTGQTLALSFS